MKKNWTTRYSVWLRARVREGGHEDKEYGAKCKACPPDKAVLTMRAGSAREGWEVARKHEREFHG